MIDRRSLAIVWGGAVVMIVALATATVMLGDREGGGISILVVIAAGYYLSKWVILRDRSDPVAPSDDE